ncbi:hypothetical protein HDU88_004726 [Geranomyces variabilis]|nr:hypothetical protein HDU88_004726 [Geranomyces variabilis]
MNSEGPVRRVAASAKKDASQSSAGSAAPRHASQTKSKSRASWARLPLVVTILAVIVPLAIWLGSSSDGTGTSRRRTRSPIKRDQGPESARGTPSYSCNPATCVLPNCHCPRQTPPGNLAVENTPQFVLLTFDDAVQIVTYPLAVNATAGTTNPNHCRMPATFFVSTQYTNYHMVQMLYKSGHEIAAHTMTHVGNPMTPEINGSRAAINAFAGIPLSDLRGFRAPFLLYNLSTLETIHDLGFTYDISNPVDPPGDVYWPYTLDNGWPVPCFTGDCGDYSRRFPGLWEISMNSLIDTNGYDYASMDPPGTPEFLMDLMQHNFKLHWDNGRLPFGLWLHPAWFMDDPAHDRIALLTDFYAWVKKYTDNQTWFVTAAQLIEWTRNPIGLDKPDALADMFDCPWEDPVEAFNASHTSVEVCNGIDDNLSKRIKNLVLVIGRGSRKSNVDSLSDGRIDEGVLLSCNLGTYFTDTCCYCPKTEPMPDNPVPDPLPGSGLVQPSTCVNVIPEGGCVQGTWSGTACECVCIGSGNQASNGFCQDEHGACTVVKTYDATKKLFLCPGDVPATPTAATTAAGASASSAAAPGAVGTSTSGEVQAPKGSSVQASATPTFAPSVPSSPSQIPCPAPSGGCMEGAWLTTSCKCVCSGAGNPLSAGYCLDARGACTIPKVWDAAGGSYLCPGDATVGVSAAAGSSQTSSAQTSSTTGAAGADAANRAHAGSAVSRGCTKNRPGWMLMFAMTAALVVWTYAR